MRKLVSTCAVLFLMLTAKSATITWICEDILGPGGTQIGVGSYTAYLFTVTGANAVVYNDIHNQLQNLALDKQGKTLIPPGTTFPGVGNGNIQKTSPDWDGDLNQWTVFKSGLYNNIYSGSTDLFMVIFNSSDIATATHYYITGTENNNMTGAGARQFDFSPILGTIGEIGDIGKWVPIPEPATMALVGIGIVAFGLRRRRK